MSQLVMNPVLIYIRLHQQVIENFFLGNSFPKTMKHDSLSTPEPQLSTLCTYSNTFKIKEKFRHFLKVITRLFSILSQKTCVSAPVILINCFSANGSLEPCGIFKVHSLFSVVSSHLSLYASFCKSHKHITA